MKEVARYSHCFVCGDQNPFGLKARFFYDGQKVVTTVQATEQFEGYRGIYHGGVIATLLDEVMIKSILATDRYAVTAEMTVRFVRPVRVGDTLNFVGRVVGHKGKLFLTEGEVRDEAGEIYATATGKYVEARDDLRQDLMKSID